MTVRIRIERSATRNLKSLAVGAAQTATLVGYGFLVAMAWILVAGRLH